MDELNEKIKQYSPYLADLFRRVYLITFSFVGLFLVGFFLSGPIIKLITQFFNFEDVVLTSTSPFQIVDLAMNIGLTFASLLITPLLIYNFYAFIGSGLRPIEKKFFFLLLPFCFSLFLFGFIYSFGILYFTMQTLANINIGLGIKNLWDISTFLAQIISTSALLGLLFEFPILMTILLKFNLFNVSLLKDKRRYVYFGMFIFVSLLPPTDGISLLLMTLPLIVMYEATIIYNVLNTGH